MGTIREKNFRFVIFTYVCEFLFVWLKSCSFSIRPPACRTVSCKPEGQTCKKPRLKDDDECLPPKLICESTSLLQSLQYSLPYRNKHLHSERYFLSQNAILQATDINGTRP